MNSAFDTSEGQMERSCLPGQVSWAVAFQAACSTFPVVESSRLGSPCWEGLPRRLRPMEEAAASWGTQNPQETVAPASCPF